MAFAGRVDDIDANILVPYYSSLKRMSNDHRECPPTNSELQNEWHYGDTGTGKSRTVREKYPDAYIKDTTEWWNGYEGEEIVIMEDLDKYHVKLGYYLKLWSDHYPYRGNMKSLSAVLIRPKKIIVTSNYSIRDIWDDPTTYEPLERRFKLIKYQKEVSSPLVQSFLDHPSVKVVQYKDPRVSCLMCNKLYCDCSCNPLL